MIARPELDDDEDDVVTSRKIDPIEMRRRLIEATVECLVDHGYAGTTTLRVQERAGVSRGALLHHFPSKADMFVAAVQRVAEQQVSDIRAALATGAPTDDRVRFAISVLRSAMSGPLYLAGYELWMAARTDEQLHEILAPYERQVGKQLRMLGAEAFGTELATLPGFPVAFESLVELLRGQALTSILRAHTAREDIVLAAWAAAFPQLCVMHEATDADLETAADRPDTTTTSVPVGDDRGSHTPGETGIDVRSGTR